MKMTSKGTLLLVAGVIGLGCSSPDDGNDDTMKPAPTAQPPYINQPQTPAATNNNQQVNNPQPTQNNETNTPTQVAQGSGGTSGAAAGAAGAGGAPATGGAIPTGAPGTGFNLTPVQGWVAGTTNEAGIQGAFSTISDATAATPGSTTITPANFSATTDAKICVSGSASQIMNNAAGDPDYARYWGGGVSFDLGDPGQMLPKVPWARGKVVGFSFNITGTTIPPSAQFRFGVAPYEGSTINPDGPCVSNIAMGANTIMFSALHSQCYNAAPGAALPDTAMLANIKWQVATVVAAATPFNFCIENLKAIVQ